MQHAYQLKITLYGTKPPVWRRVVVTEDTSLNQLHSIIQNCFDWYDSHLHEFIIGNTHYAPKEFELEMAKDYAGITLKQLGLQPKANFSYIYDFGDDWNHAVLVEAILPTEVDKPYPRCIAGKHVAPLEDCGGVPGYEEFCAILKNPKHPEYEAMAEWYGLDEGEVFDPECVDLDEINEDLECMDEV